MPIIEDFTSNTLRILAPISDGMEVTPNDNVDLPQVTRSIYVGTSGNLSVVMKSGSILNYTNVPVGRHAIRVTRVRDTGTTAGGIVAEW